MQMVGIQGNAEPRVNGEVWSIQGETDDGTQIKLHQVLLNTQNGSTVHIISFSASTDYP